MRRSLALATGFVGLILLLVVMLVEKPTEGDPNSPNQMTEALEWKTLKLHKNIRWMAVGDSITQAITPLTNRKRPFRRWHPDNGTCSYLSYLREKAQQAGVRNLSFVGPFGSAAGGPYSSHCPKPSPHHAATWGISAKQVAAEKRMTSWVHRFQPHVISLLLGTNDLAAGADPRTVVNKYVRSLVIEAFSASHNKPGCSVLIAVFSLLPRQDAINSAVSVVNDLFEKGEAWMDNRCFRFMSVTNKLNANSVLDFYDGLHPTDGGSMVLSENIFRSLDL